MLINPDMLSFECVTEMTFGNGFTFALSAGQKPFDLSLETSSCPPSPPVSAASALFTREAVHNYTVTPAPFVFSPALCFKLVQLMDVHAPRVALLRSIQKLEELNVGMEDLGEEVKSLTQQCNGNTPTSEDNKEPPSVTPEQTRGGGVLSSTPQRAAAGRPVQPPNESPVLSQRCCGCGFFCFAAGVGGRV